MAACAKLRKLNEEYPKEPLLLREGAGKVMIRRLKKYGAREVIQRLNQYIESDKFIEHPRLTAALSADTFIKIERNRLK